MLSRGESCRQCQSWFLLSFSACQPGKKEKRVQTDWKRVSFKLIPSASGAVSQAMLCCEWNIPLVMVEVPGVDLC